MRTVPIAGLVWCSIFVVLDAIQAVYLGGIFQRLDAFLIGGLAFGLPTLVVLVVVYVIDRAQYHIAFANWRALLGLNIGAAGGWVLYFFAIQLVEPAVAFTLFAGSIPLITLVAGRLGFAEGETARNFTEALGNGIIALGLLALFIFTLLGWSGFVRGGFATALLGVTLAAASGVLISLMLMFGGRLNAKGVRPLAQLGLRFPLYLLCTAIGYASGMDAKPPVPLADVMMAVVVGLVVLAFPIYAVQKAVSLVSPLTLGAMAALIPLLVFALQFVEGRVDYAFATNIGLAIYFIGAVIAAVGGARGRRLTVVA